MNIFKLELPEKQVEMTKKEDTDQVEPKVSEQVVGAQTELPDTINDTLRDDEEAKAKKGVIVMSGPLSQIYTKALNIVYTKDTKQVSKESNAIDATLTAKYMSLYEEDDQDETDLYVYVTDDNSVNKDMGTETNNLSKLMSLRKRNNNDSPLYVAVECHNSMSNEVIRFIGICRDNGCKVYLNRDNCIRGISNTVGI